MLVRDIHPVSIIATITLDLGLSQSPKRLPHWHPSLRPNWHQPVLPRYHRQHTVSLVAVTTARVAKFGATIPRDRIGIYQDMFHVPPLNLSIEAEARKRGRLGVEGKAVLRGNPVSWRRSLIAPTLGEYIF